MFWDGVIELSQLDITGEIKRHYITPVVDMAC